MDNGIVQEALRGLIYAGIALLAALLIAGTRALWLRIQVWFAEKMSQLPENQREYYETAARMVVAYVEQLVRSGRLARDAEARLNEALEAGERLLRDVFGIKNADLSVLRIFIEAVIDEIHRQQGETEPPEEPLPPELPEEEIIGERRLPAG